MLFTYTVQNSDNSNFSELFQEIEKFQVRFPYSFDKSMDEIELDEAILFEKFQYENYLIQEHQDIHWIEWIWGLFWLLAIEILGNGCLFATFVYERYGNTSYGVSSPGIQN